jgi:hypothetical protein
MYKVVFLDIDGTLIRSDHSLSRATIEIIGKLKENKILVVLVSARPLHGMLSIAEEAGLLRFPLASLNGAFISVDSEIVFESYINYKIAGEIYKTSRSFNKTTIYYQEQQWFAESQNALTSKEQEITHVPITIESFSNMLRRWQDAGTGPNKILMIAEPGIVSDIQELLKLRFKDQLNIYTSKPTYLEVMSKDASKLFAVKFLAKRYQLKRDEIIAIGDNFNDMEMISYAGFGIAMGNSPDEVKAAANYITDTNDNDGVAKAIATPGFIAWL